MPRVRNIHAAGDATSAPAVSSRPASSEAMAKAKATEKPT